MQILECPVSDLGVSFEGHVAIVEMQRPPHNFFDMELVKGLADVYDALDTDDDCRAIVLCSQGSSFCAGANFAAKGDSPQRRPREINPVYAEALRIFACSKPTVAAVQGPAIGGGLGVALTADFRVAGPAARFSANFNRIGIHPGFGVSSSLPRLVGHQQAALLIYTGRRVDAAGALRIGLVDDLVEQEDVRSAAISLAREIAASAPLAVQATRASLRAGLVDDLRLAVARESEHQNAQFGTADFKEGVRAMSERRQPNFVGG
jgi:enoyl-CoA hydratase/carnithine racemase